MELLPISIYHKKRSITIDVKKVSFLGKIRGLMFQRSSKPLLFVFNGRRKNPLHSWFVFFPFLVIWLDEKNRVLETRIIRRWSLYIAPRKPFVKVVEIPYTANYDRIIGFFVGKKKDLNTLSKIS